MRRRLPACAFRLSTAAAVALICAMAVALAGCGDETRGGPGEAARLVLTRDFGAEAVAKEAVTPVTTGLTAMRQLQANAATDTSYGGKYVAAINGMRQDPGSGRDWLFYVDGQEAVKGAAAWRIKPGEVVQWDYHRWQDVRTGGAIVGAFPRPLVTLGVDLRCASVRGRQCVTARDALAAAGVRVDQRVTGNTARVFVGEWDEIAALEDVPDLTKPAAANGAFARFTGRADRRVMELAADDGTVGRRLGAGAGLVAALKKDGAVIWIVTGVDARGVSRALRALSRNVLKNRFAVAVNGQRVTGLPVARAGETP